MTSNCKQKRSTRRRTARGCPTLVRFFHPTPVITTHLLALSGAPFIRSSACLCVRSACWTTSLAPLLPSPPPLFDLLVTSLPASSRRSGSVVAGSGHPNKVTTPSNSFTFGSSHRTFSGHHPAASSCEPLQPLLDVLLIFVFKRPSSVPGPDPHPPARPAILKQHRRSSHRLRGTQSSPQPRPSFPFPPPLLTDRVLVLSLCLAVEQRLDTALYPRRQRHQSVSRLYLVWSEAKLAPDWPVEPAGKVARQSGLETPNVRGPPVCDPFCGPAV